MKIETFKISSSSSFASQRQEKHDYFLTFSSSAITVEFIMVVVWSNGAPRSLGPNPGTAVVSSAAIDEREHTAVTS